MLQIFSKNSRYNPSLFATLQQKCQTETRFGKLANLTFFVVLTCVSIGKKFYRSIRTQGIISAFLNVFRRPSVPLVAPASDTLPAHTRKLVQTRFILIVAELSIPQCKRYRVDQKVEALRALGYTVEVRPFFKFEECMSLLPFATLVLFYRTPLWPDIQVMIRECNRLLVPTVFDIDDLVFDLEEYRRHPVLQTMSPRERVDFLKGAQAYDDCLRACDYAVASTTALAEAMERHGKDRVLVLENALDPISYRAAELVQRRIKSPRDSVVIGYGSGTRSHDKDFDLVGPALLRILDEQPHVSLRIQGYLDPGPEFLRFKDRIEIIPFLPAEAYLLSLADLDINLAPLEESVFNAAKSAIKYLEAAVVGVPTVASATRGFCEVIEHGVNGFLAADSQAWYESIIQLTECKKLRQTVGEEARARVLKRFASSTTQSRLNGFLHELGISPQPQAMSKKIPRILSVNVFYAPHRYGGATILLEQLLQRTKDTFEHAVFTYDPRPNALPYFCSKTTQNGLLVYGINFDPENLGLYDVQHPMLEQPFRNVLAEFKPDIVHFHAIQSMGTALIELAKQSGAKVVVTSHDAWWLCARHFMLQKDGTYCGQYKIDLNQCGRCTREPVQTWKRSLDLMTALENVDLLLAPSAYHHQFLRSNLPATLPMRVHKNGTDVGHQLKRQSTVGPLRFAFIGGIGATHKGYDLVKETFESIDKAGWLLTLVDLDQQTPAHRMRKIDWKSKANVQVVPPFKPQDMDAFYENIDVLLSPSLIPESFGLAAREAWSRGCQVVCARQGGLIEDLEGKPGVFLIDPSRPKELLAIVRSLLQTPLQTEGHSDFDPLVNYEDQAKELTSIYNSLRNSGKGDKLSQTDLITYPVLI